MINIGNLDISSFKVGGADCSIYLGSVKLYPNEKYSFGFYRQLRNGSEYTVSCSSSADTITSAQTRSGLTNTQISGSTQNAQNPILVIFGDCCSIISDNACMGWKWLSSVTISNGVTSIGAAVFAGCGGLTSCTIGSGVTSIGNYVFQYCSSLTSVNIPNSVTTIGNWAFGYCSSLTSIDIPNSVTSLDSSAFNSCSSLTSCTIGSGVTSISDYAFNSCSSLTSIDIPSGVTSIGYSAFYNCKSLTSITVNAVTPPTLNNVNAFNNTNNCPIYVPAESLETYKTANIWSSLSYRIQAIPNS